MNQRNASNGHLTAIAGQYDTLARRETSVALFLYHHDGITIVFTNFQLDTLRFVHCTLYALTSYATCNSACCSSQRTPGSATNSIPQETTKNSTANCTDNVGIITALNLYRTYVNDGAIADILYLFRFRSGINIP